MLQRFLREENYSVNVASKKALLNKDKAKKRLSFSKESNRNIKKINLKKIVFSDEAAIERGKGGRKEYYRKMRNNRVGTELVSRTNRGKFKRNPKRLFLRDLVLLYLYYYIFILSTITNL